ncbi:MAG: FAD-binding protein [Lachnospiraceae bacterium]|nr:FAD-binding protein [Lachnospiraceae bacterium]
MGKFISRREFLKGTMAAGAGAAVLGFMHLPVAAEEGESTDLYTPGTYSATEETAYSTITVTMEFSSDAITACTIESSGDQDLLTDELKTSMADAIVEGQGTDVDAISSCTLAASTAAIQTCVAKCIAEASGTEYEEAEAAEVTGRVKGYCGPGDWLGEAPEDPTDYEDAGTFDVIILGGGHAGVGAAFGAVDEGATVAVVEKQAWGDFVDLEGTGANMGGWYGEDIGHVNSQLLINRGYGLFDTGEITTEFCKRGAGRVNPDIVKNFVQYSGEMFDRYQEIYDSYEEERQENDSNVYLTGTSNIVPTATGDGSTGDQWVNGEPTEDEGYYDMSNMFAYPLCNTHAAYGQQNATYPIECGGYKTWPCNAQFYGYQGNNIEYVHKYMVKYVEETEGCAWDFEREGIKLIQDDTGKVTGLYAKDEDGNYYRYNCNKGVILCTGDFIGDPQMCWALLNEGMEWGERSGATADSWTTSGSRNGAGHKMACWAGGMIEPSPRGWMGLGGGVSGPWGTAPMLMLNSRGNRFVNEGSICQLSPVCLRQPAGIVSYVTDANWRETLKIAPVDHGAPNFGMQDFWDQMEADMDAAVPGQENEVTSANLAPRSKSTIYCADTLDELADMLGYTGDAKTNFLASIEHYNELCEAGADTDYGKDAAYMIPVNTAPFYGGVSSTSHSSNPMMVTMSGMVTDETQNVLNQDWEPIEGRYVAGNCLGGRYGLGYSTPFAGNSVGMAMTHGWIAGHQVGSDKEFLGTPVEAVQAAESASSGGPGPG